MNDVTTFLGRKLEISHTGAIDDVVEVLKGIRNFDADTILEPRYSDLHDPLLMQDMQAAVDRIKKAQESSERVMIFGDYDADGVSSTAALFLFLRDEMGVSVSYRLPDRLKDGYGMKQYFIDDIKQTGASLIITVDCGIRDHDVIAYARSLDMDVVVTDHHTPGETLPQGTCATVNPHRSDCAYPFKHLSGSGVVLKLIQALCDDEHVVKKYIDICTIGTIADVMPLIGENRTIASLGLKKMRRSEHTSFQELAPKKGPIDADFIGFQMGPLINAAGRMDSPVKALNMLIAKGQTARSCIRDLQSLNERRKAETKKHFEQTLLDLDTEKDLLVSAGDIPHGIIGLVAGKLCERHHKPVIILAQEEDVYVGSCRSPEYFHIVHLLEKFSDHFESFGGHRQAAGFTIKREKWDDIVSELQSTTTEIIKEADTTPHLRADMELQEESIALEVLDALVGMQPFGVANEKPCFVLPDLSLQSIRRLGTDGQHLKIQTQVGDIVAWNWGEYFDNLKNTDQLTVIGELAKNEWNGNVSLQIRMIDCVL